MLLKEVLLKEFKRRGVERIFGIPGRENEKILFNEVEGLEYITTRVEFTAGVAADMSGRLDYKPQVCFSTMGPGATNMTTAVASAMLNKSPVIYFTAQLESNDNFYNITHQCVDQTSILKPITKWSYELKTPEELPNVLENAFETIMTEPVGPVHIAIPTDFFNKDIKIDYDLDKTIEHKVIVPNKEISEVKILDLIKILKESKNPVCLLGQEIKRVNAIEEVNKFCNSWNIPFVTAANMKGISQFQNDPLNYGSASCYMEGILRYPALKTIFEESDLIVLIGYQYVDDLLPKMWDYGLEKKIVLINSVEEPKLNSIFNLDFSIYGSIKEIFGKVSEYKSFKKKNRHLNELKETYDFSLNLITKQSLEERMDPIEVMSVINKNLEDGFLITDIGYYRHHAILFSEPSSTGRFFSDTGLSSFGSGLPSAIAAKLNNRNKKVFLICGDGGFHSGSGDLATLVKYNLPIIIIVLNNNSYELINLYQSKNKVNSNSEILDLSSVDFVKLAEANKCNGVSVKNVYELNDAIESFDNEKPLLIEVSLQYTDDFQISF